MQHERVLGVPRARLKHTAEIPGTGPCLFFCDRWGGGRLEAIDGVPLLGISLVRHRLSLRARAVFLRAVFLLLYIRSLISLIHRGAVSRLSVGHVRGWPGLTLPQRAQRANDKQRDRHATATHAATAHVEALGPLEHLPHLCRPLPAADTARAVQIGHLGPRRGAGAGPSTEPRDVQCGHVRRQTRHKNSSRKKCERQKHARPPLQREETRKRRIAAALMRMAVGAHPADAWSLDERHKGSFLGTPDGSARRRRAVPPPTIRGGRHPLHGRRPMPVRPRQLVL